MIQNERSISHITGAAPKNCTVKSGISLCLLFGTQSVLAWGLHADRCLELIFFSFFFFFLRPNDSPSPLCIKLIEVDNDCADILNRLWLPHEIPESRRNTVWTNIFFTLAISSVSTTWILTSVWVMPKLTYFLFTPFPIVWRKNTDLGIIKHKYIIPSWLHVF